MQPVGPHVDAGHVGTLLPLRVCMDQLEFFGTGESGYARRWPPGFRAQADFLTLLEETVLLRHLRTLPFKPFEFHGHTGKRRTVSFGWHYDFATERLQEAAGMPPFLDALRPRVAAFAGVPTESLTHVLVTEYEAGAGIGWHRDKAVFDRIVGISLGASCAFRLRRASGAGWERVTIDTAPRSIYVLSGEARSDWEHSIPPVEVARFSITFRNLRPR